jgi:drug/metabolite transporter (DMT)-like permease
VFTTATNTSWLIASSPIFVALLAHVLLGERLVRRQWIGMACGLAGAAVMVTAGAGGRLVSGPRVGDLLIVGSAMAWGLYSALGKRLLGKYPPTIVSGYGLGMGMGVAIPAWLLLGGVGDLGKQSGAGWGALLYLAIPATAVAHWLWYRAMRRLPAGVVGAYMFLPPLVATFLSRIWLDEPLPWPTVIGALLILGGVALVTWRGSQEDSR